MSSSPISSAALARSFKALRRCAAVAAIALLPSSMLMAVQNRIANVDDRVVRTMPGTVHPFATAKNDLGMVSPQMSMSSLVLHFRPSAQQQSDLDALLKAQQTPGSAQYQKWLTQAEFGTRFGMSTTDLAKVKSWLEAQGFTVKRVSASRNSIEFSGTAGQVETAFHTQIHNYKVDGETRFANATELSVPSALSSVVLGVRGVDNFRLKPRSHVARKRISPNFTSGSTGNHYLTPADFATIYNIKPLWDAGYDGTGMHIAVVGQTAIFSDDIDAFRLAAGLPGTNLNQVCISAANCTAPAGVSKDDLGEADLDVEWAGGIARNATIDYIYASGVDANLGVMDALAKAIQDYTVDGTTVVPIISMSYGACETAWTATSLDSLQSLINQASAQGQTVIVSSGDAGAAGCDYTGTTAKSGAVVDMPAGTPGVTAIGGTRFSGDGTDTYADSYWTGVTGSDILSSALQYIPETSWNDTTADIAAGAKAFSSSGGGVSTHYAKPSYQMTPSNFTGTAGRFVPDISFTASADHDGYLVCSQTFTGDTASTYSGTDCKSGFRYTNNTLSVFGGTSAGAPSFAGALALVYQANGSNMGSINPTLYSLASDSTKYATIFHDVTTGDNKVPCTTGTGCTNGSVGYSATTGYDLVTGLGSVDIGALFAAVSGKTLPSKTATATTLAVSPTAPNAGDTITLTATVAASSGTTVPSGTVSFKVDGTLVQTVTLSNGAASTTTTITSGGSHVIAAGYSGDSDFNSSAASSSISVTAPTYTMSLSSKSLSLSSGASGTITISLASSGYAGAVTITPAASSSTALTTSLQGSPVTLTSGGTGTATLTIKAISTTASAGHGVHGLSTVAGGGVVLAFSLLLLPISRSKKRAAELMLLFVCVASLFGMSACGGGGTSTTTTPITKTPVTYTVTITPTGSGTVTNAAAQSITVTVQ